MNRIVAVLLIAVMLAGCGSKDNSGVSEPPEGPSASVDSADGDDQLHGWVLDGKFQPIEGAVVTVHGYNVTSRTGPAGYYGFSGMETDTLLTVQVEAEEFKPQTRAITLLPDSQTLVNFTLLPVPVATPYDEVHAMTAHIECGAVFVTQESRQPYDCSAAGAVDNRVWEFTVNGNVATIVVEAFWDYDTQLAEHLNLTVETVNLGIFDEILAENEGQSPLQGIVTNEQSNRFYRQGGTVRVSVDIGRNIDDEEAGIGAGVAVDQEVQLIATVFYVAPAPPGYTAAS